VAEKQIGGTGIGAQVFMAIMAVLIGAVAWLFGWGAMSQPTIEWGRVSGALVFGIIAALFVVFFFAAGASRRDQLRIAERQATDPDRPWLWSEEWAQGRITSWESRGSAVGFLVPALAWDAVTIGGMWAVNARDAWVPGTILWAVAFSAAGLGLTGAAIYKFLQRRKYAPAVLEMESVPGVLGGRLKGVVQLPDQVPPQAEAALSIRCERITKAGKSSTTWKLWEDKTHLRVPDSRSVRVDFSIPYDLPPSEAPGSSPTSPVYWLLAVHAKTPGVDYGQLFRNVPVFATAASDPSILKGAVDSTAALERPPDAKVRVVEDSPERTVFAWAPTRALGGGLAVFVLLPFVAWVVARSVASDQSAVTMWTAVAFFAGAGILALTCLGVAFAPAGVEIVDDRVLLRLGAWPLSRTRTIPIADIVEIKYTTAQATAWVNAQAAGKSHVLSPSLSDVEAAKWLATEMARVVERHRRNVTASVT
jgi:hypothetical protein